MSDFDHRVKMSDFDQEVKITAARTGPDAVQTRASESPALARPFNPTPSPADHGHVMACTAECRVPPLLASHMGRAKPPPPPRHRRRRVAAAAQVFMGGLPADLDEAAVRRLAEEAGPVDRVVLLADPETGLSKGVAFVTMATPADAARACEALHGRKVRGRAIRVNMAASKRQ